MEHGNSTKFCTNIIITGSWAPGLFFFKNEFSYFMQSAKFVFHNVSSFLNFSKSKVETSLLVVIPEKSWIQLQALVLPPTEPLPEQTQESLWAPPLFCYSLQILQSEIKHILSAFMPWTSTRIFFCWALHIPLTK